MNKRKKYRFMRFALSALVCLPIVMLSVSCKSDNQGGEYYTAAKDIADAVMACFDESEIPEMTLYHYGAEQDSENFLEAEYAGFLINGNYAPVPEIENLADYAFCIPSGHHAFEIDVLRVKDKNDVESVKQILEERLNKKNNGDIQLYNPDVVPMLEDSRIITSGNFVALLTTPDNSVAQKALKEAAKPQKTNAPNVTVSQYSRNTMYIIGGKCEEGAVINVTGGEREISSKSDTGGNFLVEVPIKDKKSTLKLTAQVEGKGPSDVEKIKVSPQKDVDIYEKHGATATFVGNDYQSIFSGSIPDFTGSNLLDDDGMSYLEQRLTKKLEALKNSGVTSEIIYLIAPNPMNIYAELMPPEYERNTENSLLKQFSKAASAAGATVIDLTETMMDNKEGEFKIYHKTDSHWTDYGAYLGYRELMTHIGQKFPDAAPRPESDFKFYNKELFLGDIFMMLEIGEQSLSENTTFVEFGFDPPEFKNIYKQGNIYVIHEIVGYEHQTTTNLTGEFPTAYIFRDSYGGPIYPYLTDRFSAADWGGWGQYEFHKTDIMSTNPDYIIYIVTERNISNIMYE